MISTEFVTSTEWGAQTALLQHHKFSLVCGSLITGSCFKKIMTQNTNSCSAGTTPAPKAKMVNLNILGVSSVCKREPHWAGLRGTGQTGENKTTSQTWMDISAGVLKLQRNVFYWGNNAVSCCFLSIWLHSQIQFLG